MKKNIILVLISILLLSVYSLPSFAGDQVYELKLATHYKPDGFPDYARGIFKSVDDQIVRITCRAFPFTSDDLILATVEEQKYINYEKMDIEDADECADDLKEIIQMLEAGNFVSVKLGVLGLSFKEIIK